MKTNGNDKALESYKIFPYVAWALVIGFAFFVYNITLQLQAISTELAGSSGRLDVYVHQVPGVEVEFKAEQ